MFPPTYISCDSAVLPSCPLLACVTPGISRRTHPEGEPCNKVKSCYFFLAGRAFARRTRTTDLGAALLVRRRIDRGPARRKSRTHPRPVARVARCQSRPNRVSFAGDPFGSAVPSMLRETCSAIRSFSNKMANRSQRVFL